MAKRKVIRGAWRALLRDEDAAWREYQRALRSGKKSAESLRNRWAALYGRRLTVERKIEERRATRASSVR